MVWRLISLFVAVPLAAQAPEGWTWRLDGAQVEPVAAGELEAGQWAWQAMPPGWHLTTTTRGATLYPVEPHRLAGRWAIEMEFFIFPDPGESGVGISLVRADRPADVEIRVLLRRDGQVGIAQGEDSGSETMLVPWTSDTAAVAHDGSEIKRYVLRFSRELEALSVAVDGRTMLRVPTVAEETDPATLAGIRIGAGLNVHVSRFDLVTPLAPASK